MTPQEIIESLTERLVAMIRQGIPPSQAPSKLAELLVHTVKLDQTHAVALADLATEHYANIYEKRRVFTDDQLKQRLEVLKAKPQLPPPNNWGGGL